MGFLGEAIQGMLGGDRAIFLWPNVSHQDTDKGVWHGNFPKRPSDLPEMALVLALAIQMRTYSVASTMAVLTLTHAEGRWRLQ